MQEARKAIGILGGMGPAATVDLFRQIVANTDAGGDADHARILIDNDPAVPDRTAALLHGGPSPLPNLIRMARGLEKMGAGVLGISCNTSHFFYEQVAAAVSVPIVNMIEESAREVARMGASEVIVLATEGTMRMRLYHDYMKKFGITVRQMTDKGQGLVTDMIYRYIKEGAPTYPREAFISEMKETGADACPLVLGCTELPIAFRQLDITAFRTVDPTVCLARALIREAGYPLREAAVIGEACHG